MTQLAGVRAKIATKTRKRHITSVYRADLCGHPRQETTHCGHSPLPQCGHSPTQQDCRDSCNKAVLPEAVSHSGRRFRRAVSSSFFRL
jgi:hypothetical protein